MNTTSVMMKWLGRCEENHSRRTFISLRKKILINTYFVVLLVHHTLSSLEGPTENVYDIGDACSSHQHYDDVSPV